MYLDGSAMLGQGKTTFGFGTFSAGPGGAVPLPGESMTYLYRNEVLDSVDALQVCTALESENTMLSAFCFQLSTFCFLLSARAAWRAEVWRCGCLTKKLMLSAACAVCVSEPQNLIT
jgi:hypothetical protein